MARRIRSHIRNNVVGYVALFFAVTGVAWAGALKRNSVTTKSIKNAAVTNSKLAPGAVTGDKIAPGSISGSQINLSTLGTVPNAVHANNADTLGGTGPAGFLSSGTVQRYGPVVVASGGGGSVTLLSIPPYTLTPGCVINNGGAMDIATTHLASTNGPWAFSDLDSAGGGFGNANQTGAANIGNIAVPTGNKAMGSAMGTAVDSAGKQISFQVYEGVNIVGNTAHCVFGGTVVLNY